LSLVAGETFHHEGTKTQRNISDAINTIYRIGKKIKDHPSRRSIFDRPPQGPSKDQDDNEKIKDGAVRFQNTGSLKPRGENKGTLWRALTIFTHSIPTRRDVTAKPTG
jgi:hypothetical protein